MSVECRTLFGTSHRTVRTQILRRRTGQDRNSDAEYAYFLIIMKFALSISYLSAASAP